MRHTDQIVTELWQEAEASGEAKFPWEYVYDLLDRPELEQYYQVVVDAIFAVPTNVVPLKLSLYYYPQHEKKVEELLEQIGKTVQP